MASGLCIALRHAPGGIINCPRCPPHASPALASYTHSRAPETGQLSAGRLSADAKRKFPILSRRLVEPPDHHQSDMPAPPWRFALERSQNPVVKPALKVGRWEIW
ncbi:hypothetical protein GPALN_005921 [Globodera pallida]|nr:hypothetical protein GPALN_005921 [Globodera pallida]